MSQLLEEILSKDNMVLAYKRVKANGGASGIDGITVGEIDEYLKANWVEIREQIRRRKYQPQPVRRVEIPKPNGGVSYYHSVTLYEETICTDCYQSLGSVIVSGYPILKPHPITTSTSNGFHQGHFSKHYYYIYSDCYLCGYHTQTKHLTGCTAAACVELGY